MELVSRVDAAAKAPVELAVQARASGSVVLSWSQAEHGPRCAVGWPGPRPALADVLPLFDHLGLQLMDHQPAEEGDAVADVFTFRGLKAPQDSEVLALLGEAFLAEWERRCDRDGFSVLVPTARLNWRQVQLVRVAFQYLRQAGLGASRRYVQDILVAHPDFLRHWLEVFEDRFDPHRASSTEDRLDQMRDAATTRDEDRVLGWYAGFGRAVTRTNYFRRGADGQPNKTIVIKLDPARLPFRSDTGLVVETFVHHPDVEGLHVRCGPVARGGVRWSDRLEDYRSEVLALVKAQQVKNALIVPAGAKGVFVVKAPTVGLDQATATLELSRCYRIFVRGLLDVTDTVVDGVVQHPSHTVITDDDDPYLVIAADKGTAAFSDLANAEAEDSGFWLRDAFASGGSSGYDHKRLGITARGAWMAVRRHFTELGLDVDREQFTVVGIGDMSGDVFGNGMLMSPHIRLIAAFDHRHVFLDPDPNPVQSFQERQRLASLPGSSWADYNRAVLSEGGSVSARSARVVHLSPQVCMALRLEASEASPEEVVRAILRAPVDLLWVGGVGTFVRGSTESDIDVGDRSNNKVRVAASELRCRVVGEGGNLGLTQAARIEYAESGGRVNADFIDNAGGVNLSDREVNLKILLRGPVDAKQLGGHERDQILDSCTADVVDAVVADIRLQTLAISVAEADAPLLIDRHEQVMSLLEQVAGLDRDRERLPRPEEIADRRSNAKGLVRPEIALLLAHAKNLSHALLLASDLPSDPSLQDVLYGYFPAPVRRKFARQIREHILARDIIATRLANDLVNEVGPGFIYRLQDRTGADAPQAIRAYLVVRDLLGLSELWQGLGVLPLALMMPVRRALERTLEHNMCWLLRRRASTIDIDLERRSLRPTMQRMLSSALPLLPGPIDAGFEQALQALSERGVGADLVRAWSAVGRLVPALDLASTATELDCDVSVLAEHYVQLGDVMQWNWPTALVRASDSHWTQMAQLALRDEMMALQTVLAGDALRTGGVDEWVRVNAPVLKRASESYADLVNAETADIAVTAIRAQVMRDVAQAVTGRN